MAYPFEKMTTRKLRSKLQDRRKWDRPNCDDFDRSEANPLNVNSRSSDPTHCKTNESPTSR